MEVIFSRAPKAVRFGAPKSGDELLPLVQLVLSALSLRLEHRTVWSFDMSQRLSYMPVTAEPLFRGRGGTDVNLDWALHVINFFRYHALRDEEATLYAPWKDLTEDNSGLGLPQLMKQRLNNDGSAVVGQEWQGTYGESLQPLLLFSMLISDSQPILIALISRRSASPPRAKMATTRTRTSMAAKAATTTPSRYDIFSLFSLEHLLIFSQRLKINFPARPKYAWPQVFENHLQSVTFHRDRLSGLVMPAPRGTRQAQHSAMPADTPIFPWGSSRRFEGMGYDEENFFGSGWINPLPAQFGVPGFKRMTMMKFFKDENGLIDIDALWAYEGVVLPGDQIIVGRWWAPEGLDRESKKNMYSGPFILWNVDGLEAHKKEKKLAEQIERLGLDL